MHSVVTTTVSDDTEDEEEEEEDIVEPEEEKPGTVASFTPIIVPSMSYLAQVPSKTQPELLSLNKKELRALEEAKAWHAGTAWTRRCLRRRRWTTM